MKSKKNEGRAAAKKSAKKMVSKKRVSKKSGTEGRSGQAKKNEGVSFDAKPGDIVQCGVEGHVAYSLVIFDFLEILVDGINMWHLWGVQGIRSLCIFDFGIIADESHVGFNITFLNLMLGIAVGRCEEGVE